MIFYGFVHWDSKILGNCHWFLRILSKISTWAEHACFSFPCTWTEIFIFLRCWQHNIVWYYHVRVRGAQRHTKHAFSELEQYYSCFCVSVDKKNTMMLLLSKCEPSPHLSLLPLPPPSAPHRVYMYTLTQCHHYSCCVNPVGTHLTLVNIRNWWWWWWVGCARDLLNDPE